MPASLLTAPRRIGAALLLAFVSALCTASPTSAAPGAMLLGRVAAEHAVPIVVVAFRSGHIVHRLYLERAGAFRMPLEPGKYRIYAYADPNRDGERDAGDATSEVFALSSALRAGDRIELPELRIRPLTIAAATERAPRQP